MTKPTLAELLQAGGSAGHLAKVASLDYSGAKMANVECRRAELRGMKLAGAQLDGCDFEAMWFRDADLTGAYVRDCTFRWCDFRAANLAGVTFENVAFSECDFTYAPGLDTTRFEACELERVIGVRSEDPPDADERDGPPTLGRLLPRGFGSLAFSELLDVVARVATVTTGKALSSGEIEAMEASLHLAFPDDYRSFLRTCGTLRIVGDDAHDLGTLDVHGADLPYARARLRAAFDEKWGWFGDLTPAPRAHDPASFFDGFERPAVESPTLEEKRVALRDELLLSEEHLVAFHDDPLDKARIAYQFMAPIITLPRAPSLVAQCVGPGRRVYTVSVKGDDVDSPSGTFQWRLGRSLARIVTRA